MDKPLGLPRRSGEPRQSGEQRAPEQGRTAALMQRASVPAKAKLMTTTTGSGRNGKSWEDEVIDFDRNGPGILGYYLDTVALLATMVPFVVEELNSDGRWERSEDGVLSAIAAAFRGHLPQITQAELVFRAVRAREALGRCWIIADQELGWCVTARGVPQDDPDKSLVWTTMYGTQRKTPGDRVYYSWVGDTYDDWLPTSSVRRALPDLRRIRAAVRNQTRTSNSRMLTNGLLAFPDGEFSTSRPMASTRNDDGTESELTGVDALLDDFLDLAKLGFADDDSPAANIPFPYIGQKAEWISLGGDIDQGSFDSERMGIEGFARSVNFPQKLLTEGPGDSNHWNEYLLNETMIRVGLAPKVDPVADQVTACHFRPLIALFSRQLSDWHKVPARCRIVPDYDRLLQRPKQGAEMLSAYQSGVASRQEVADAFNITDKLDLPNGMSEFEFWELVSHVSGAPYSETDPDGNLIVPAAPGGAMGGFELGTGEGVTAPPTGIPGAEPTPGTDVAEPPMPTAVTAAASKSDRMDPNDVYEWAVTQDQRLEAKLDATAEVIVAAITAEIARRVVMAMPPRSEERSRLRDMDPSRVWLAAPLEARSNVDPEQVAREVVEKHRQQVQTIFVEGQQSLARRWGPLLGAVITAEAISKATSALLAAIVPWYVIRFGKGTVEKSATGATITRSAMAVAAGAKTESDMTMTVSAGNTPIPTEGGEWRGNLGMFTGHAVTQALSSFFGQAVEWQWIHGFYGEPQDPYPPHVDLDRQRFPNPAAVPGGFSILDHPGCRCGWQLRWSSV